MFCDAKKGHCKEPIWDPETDVGQIVQNQLLWIFHFCWATLGVQDGEKRNIMQNMIFCIQSFICEAKVFIKTHKRI